MTDSVTTSAAGWPLYGPLDNSPEFDLVQAVRDAAPAPCVCPPGLRSAIGDIASWDVGLLKSSKVAEWGEGAFKVERECGWQTWRVLRIYDVRTDPRMPYQGRAEAIRVV